jgi:hypothetical protein
MAKVARPADRDRECRRRRRFDRADAGGARGSRRLYHRHRQCRHQCGDLYDLSKTAVHAGILRTVAVVAKTFGIVALRKDFPAKNLQDFIAYAKKKSGKVNLGHAGVGSSNFLICKSFAQAAGIEVTLVGYRGAAPA